MGQVRLNGNEQAVVHGPTDRHIHLVLTDVRVDASKGTGGAGRAAGFVESGIEAITGIVGNGGTLGESAVDAGGTGGATKPGVGGIDRRLGVRYVQEPCITDFVCVDPKQVVEADVSDVVHA